MPSRKPRRSSAVSACASAFAAGGAVSCAGGVAAAIGCAGAGPVVGWAASTAPEVASAVKTSPVTKIFLSIMFQRSFQFAQFYPHSRFKRMLELGAQDDAEQPRRGERGGRRQARRGGRARGGEGGVTLGVRQVLAIELQFPIMPIHAEADVERIVGGQHDLRGHELEIASAF